MVAGPMNAFQGSNTSAYPFPRPHASYSTSFPLASGSDSAGASHSLAQPGHSFQSSTSQAPEKRCFYLLMTPSLEVLHADPALDATVAAHLRNEDVTRLIHEEERARASEEMKGVIASKALFGTVTR